MTFTVTYRAKDGALHDETVEVASRAECVAVLKARGIVPVSVREGRASARLGSGKSAASQNAPMIRKAAILAAAVLVVVGIVWWWFAARLANAPAQALEAPRRVQPAEKPKAAPPPATKSVPVPIASTVTNASAVSTNKPPARKEETYIDERGIETKKQLKAAMERGEDIAQIMTDTRNELRRLGQYREELRRELHKLRAGGEYTDQEIEDFTAAANKLLADKGCRPIKMPTLLLRYVREKQAKRPQQQN